MAYHWKQKVKSYEDYLKDEVEKGNMTDEEFKNYKKSHKSISKYDL